MSTYFLQWTAGAGAIGPGTNSGITEAGTTSSTASVQAELNTTATPSLSRADAVQALLSMINYIIADGYLASPVLTLRP